LFSTRAEDVIVGKAPELAGGGGLAPGAQLEAEEAAESLGLLVSRGDNVRGPRGRPLIRRHCHRELGAVIRQHNTPGISFVWTRRREGRPELGTRGKQRACVLGCRFATEVGSQVRHDNEGLDEARHVTPSHLPEDAEGIFQKIEEVEQLDDAFGQRVRIGSDGNVHGDLFGEIRAREQSTRAPSLLDPADGVIVEERTDPARHVPLAVQVARRKLDPVNVLAQLPYKRRTPGAWSETAGSKNVRNPGPELLGNDSGPSKVDVCHAVSLPRTPIVRGGSTSPL
jgi:hypothetical protein